MIGLHVEGVQWCDVRRRAVVLWQNMCDAVVENFTSMINSSLDVQPYAPNLSWCPQYCKLLHENNYAMRTQDGKKIPASMSSTIDAAAANQEEVSLNDVFADNNNNNNNSHRSGRRGSSRSLASVIEDMELDEDDVKDDYGRDDDDDNSKAGKKMPVVMQFEQRILDRLEQQEDKRTLVRTRSEASLHSGRSIGGSTRGSGSARRLGGDLPGSSSSNDDNEDALRQEHRSLRGSRAVQSERVLTDRARDVQQVRMETMKKGMMARRIPVNLLVRRTQPPTNSVSSLCFEDWGRKAIEYIFFILYIACNKKGVEFYTCIHVDEYAFTCRSNEKPT